MSGDMRELTAEQLLHWADDRTSVMRLNTDRDVLPGGYMAALTPLLVSWPESEVRPDRATVIVRNINYGGNPFERTTLLHSVSFALEAVEAAELILVPLGEYGKLGEAYHVQVRYIFEQGAEPVLLDLADARTGTDPRLPDLVLSWESWRAPKTPFDLRTGLAAREVGLSLRAYAGAQRYLEDTIRNNDWYAYRLRLPGGRLGLRELLAVSLTLGDSLARETLARLLDAGEQDWLARAPRVSGESDAAEQWQALKERLPRQTEVEEHLPPLPEGERTYHVLLRSCTTLMRYLILLAARRLVLRGEAGDFDASKLPDLAFGDPQPWMKEVAKGSLLRLFLCAPAALRFLLAHPESRPALLPETLDSAGLLEHRHGKRLELVYGRNATRPYGSSGIRRDPQ